MPLNNKYNDYFDHLSSISLLGKFYKKFISSPLIYQCANSFGNSILEVGSGIGNGILGTFPSHVVGVDINSNAVNYCNRIGLNAKIIKDDGLFPFADSVFDSCVLDNVLEHIPNPAHTLNECWRVTKNNGGLVVVVPGVKGFDSDRDHKVFYGKKELMLLNERWEFIRLFAMPTYFINNKISKILKQYCLVATYKKIDSKQN
ncbi:methyltransferase domain-containing protein [Polynucleobacter sp. AP-Nickl1-40-C4]|uniref:methyltransferase domain-containing protein n=1 Tax=Polynucleobacter sp. AP-Nickl1-40-C4 TaxID=3108275 RepID=UPI002B22E822|nr:methyltransferase domain-containing protein [Polynucleobacter sp. AP-Nickl1-40-C4]MEA9568014.1 methyltransferase domain-containing protein [Polynucleobacter sp. AP-Nickl1-40-C4]